MQFGSYICSGAYDNNVKHMYTSIPCHSFDCIDFIEGMYTEIAISHLHMN